MKAAVEELIEQLAGHAYLADRPLATSVHLAASLGRPLLLEGDAGVGKTELAKVLAAIRGAELVRLQCHEGLDRAQALYAWDHARQLLHLRAMEASGDRPADHVDALYDERFLLERPLLRALRRGADAVLLVDEIDRADDEFEAFLLELLADGQVTIPELGTIVADAMPLVILTSNRTRELSDALKRRCLYHWIDHPDRARETAIVRARAPQVPEQVARRVAAIVARLRELDLYKPPGVAETIDWARVLAVGVAISAGDPAAIEPEQRGSATPGDRQSEDIGPASSVDGAAAVGEAQDGERAASVDSRADVASGTAVGGAGDLDLDLLLDTLGVVLKDHDDLVLVRANLAELLAS